MSDIFSKDQEGKLKVTSTIPEIVVEKSFDRAAVEADIAVLNDAIERDNALLAEHQAALLQKSNIIKKMDELAVQVEDKDEVIK